MTSHVLNYLPEPSELPSGPATPQTEIGGWEVVEHGGDCSCDHRDTGPMPEPLSPPPTPPPNPASQTALEDLSNNDVPNYHAALRALCAKQQGLLAAKEGEIDLIKRILARVVAEGETQARIIDYHNECLQQGILTPYDMYMRIVLTFTVPPLDPEALEAWLRRQKSDVDVAAPGGTFGVMVAGDCRIGGGRREAGGARTRGGGR